MKNVFLALACLLIPVSVLAQSMVHLQGKVLAANGSPVSDAQIRVTDMTTKSVITTDADHKGKYSLDFLSDDKDSYTLSAQKGELVSASQVINPKHIYGEVALTIGAPLATADNLPANQPATYKSPANIL